MRTMFLCGFLFVATAAVAGCKTNTITQNNEASGATIGPQGGIVKGPEGAALRIPGGALTEATAFTIGLAEAGDYPAVPTNVDVGGNHIFAFEPHGLEFLSPATVVVPFVQKPTEGVLLRAEKGDASWHEVPVTGNGASTYEGTVSSLSFFVVADKNVAASGTDKCAGRGPAAGKTNGTIASTSSLAIGSATFDFGKAVSGYASPGDPTVGYKIAFTDYANACGYNTNGDWKIGSKVVSFDLSGSNATPTVRTYAPNEVGVTILENAASTKPGSPAGQQGPQITCGTGGSGSMAGGGTGLTITAVDATHIAGSFDMKVQSSQLTGTFDLPICPPDPSLDAQTAVTNRCCVQ